MNTRWVLKSSPESARWAGVLLLLSLVVVARPVSGADCNNNGAEDSLDVAGDVSEDCNGNSVPDECEGAPVTFGLSDSSVEIVSSPNLSATGDMNNDDRLDLVLASNHGLTATITVLLGGGDRRFASGSGLETLLERFVPAADVADLAVGDVNGDDKQDVVTANGGFLLVLLGQGSGRFAAPARYDNEVESRLIALGDINGDDVLDLICADIATVGVRLNLGDGTFGDPAVTMPVGQDPRGLTTGDFDGDGDLDVATLNRGPQDFSVLLNNGDGSFAAAVSYPGSLSPAALEAADLDLDGALDLVAIGTGSLDVLINVGNGTFADTVSYAVAPRVGDTFAVSDFNGDAAPDVAFLARQTNTLTVRVNDGIGRFDVSVAVQDFAVSVPTSIEPGDFDGDHLTDLAIGRGSPARVQVFWNGDRPPVSLRRETIDVFGLCNETSNRGCRPHWEAIADLNGDTYPDIIACNTHRGTFVILLNDGFGNMVPQPGYEFGGEHPQGLDVGDVDNDGDIDVVTCDNLSFDVWVHLNNGDATFLPPTRTAVGNGAVHVKLGHLNDDGNLDAATADEGGGTVSVLLGTGGGAFSMRQFYTVGSGPKSVEIADLDLDGNQDLVVANSGSRHLSFLRNNGDDTFAAAVDIDLPSSSTNVTSADLDFDGDVDLATANSSGQSCSVLLNRGNGTFGPAASYAAGHSPFGVIVADVNVDGNLDLVTSSELDSSLSVLVATDDLRFGQPQVFGSGLMCRYVVSADLDSDGDPDFVTNDREGTSMTIFYNRATEENDGQTFSDDICTGAEFQGLSIPISSAADERFVKFTMPTAGGVLPGVDVVAFQNMHLFPLHLDFLKAEFDQFAVVTPAQYNSLVNNRASRQYFVGTISRLRSPAGYLYGFSVVAEWNDPVEALTEIEVQMIYQQLQRAFHLETFAYFPGDRRAIDVAREWGDTDFPVNFDGAPPPPTGREVYTAGRGIGFVQILTAAEFERKNASGEFGFQDILVLAEAPRDIEGVVAAIFTAEPQGQLSHVAIRTNLRGTPNAFMDDGLEVFAPFEGKLVRVDVTCEETAIAEVSLAEAEAWWADIRPSLPSPPTIDEDYADFPDLDAIGAMDTSGVDPPIQSRVGGKATGLARLQTILDGRWSEYREKGFAVPIHHYLQFMSTNHILSAFDDRREVTYQEYLEELFASDEFLTNSSLRFAALEALRVHMLQHGQVDPQLIDDLDDRILEVFGSTTLRVRFRSSSNGEDSLEFNGAGLYDSTSVCAADDLDGDVDGPSQCQAFKKDERGVAHGLKTVWASLWNLRAYEERAFYQIPQLQIGMAVLVNRSFPDEKSNGVAFTGNPSNPFDSRYVVTAQLGEESVVSPQPGVLPETNILVVENGEVLDVVRAGPSSLVPGGTFVLSREEVDELGALMAHIDQNLPLDLGAHSRDDVLVDMEFKFEPNGDLAVKQVRPFLLVDQGPPPPSFEMVIPPNTMGCGAFVISRPARDEFELKSTIRLRGGSFPLPTDVDSFEADIVEEVVIGPEREVLTPVGPGRVGLERVINGCAFSYQFTYEQSFRFATGQVIDLVLDQLDFSPADVGEPRVVDAESLIDDVSLQFRNFETGGETAGQVLYSSCTHETLPLFDVNAELADGTTIHLQERFREELSQSRGPASLVGATIVLGGQTHVVSDYFNLVYSAVRHNDHQVYWAVLDPPVEAPVELGLERPVHVVELRAAFDLTSEAASYLDEDFNVLKDVAVPVYERTDGILFRRGDCNLDNRTNISDAIQHARMLFAGTGSAGCNEACDSNGDGESSIADPIYLVEYLFKSGPQPPSPFDICSDDPDPGTSLGCRRGVCE